MREEQQQETLRPMQIRLRQVTQEILRRSAAMVQDFLHSDEIKSNQIIGYVVITNDIVTSSLNAVTSFGHAIVVITTKVRVAEENVNLVTPRW